MNFMTFRRAIAPASFALFLAGVAVVGYGCGGGSSSSDPVALCKSGCDKAISLCFADAGVDTATLKASCQSSCTSQSASNPKNCTNSSAIISAYNTCLAKTTCDELQSCTASIPACEGGSTGTGGSSGGGTGGATGGGTGGASGGGTGGSTATGTGCADLLACCNATTNATLKLACMQSYAGVMAMGDAICAQALTAIQSTYCP